LYLKEDRIRKTGASVLRLLVLNAYHVTPPLFFFFVRVSLPQLGVPEFYVREGAVVQVLGTYYLGQILGVVACAGKIVLNAGNVHALVCSGPFQLKLTPELGSLGLALVVLLLDVIVLLDAHLRHGFHHETLERR